MWLPPTGIIRNDIRWGLATPSAFGRTIPRRLSNYLISLDLGHLHIDNQSSQTRRLTELAYKKIDPQVSRLMSLNFAAYGVTYTQVRRRCCPRAARWSR